jgi:drug/metabolite transporter (DMT)-like permease
VTGRRWHADLALGVNALIWGITFQTVKNALPDASPILFVAARFSLAAILLIFIYRRRLDRRMIIPGCLVGLLLFAGYAFQTAGLRYTSPSKSAFITGLSIPMVPLLASIVYRRRPRPIELAGVLVATFGMSLITLQDIQLHRKLGDVLTLLCAAAFAGHIVLLGYFGQRALRAGIGFESLAVWQIVAAAMFGFVTFRWLEAPRWHMSTKLAIALAITGFAATAFAFTVQTWAQRHTTATRTALIYALEPVFAWIFSWMLTGESLGPRAAAGAGLILFGILLVEVKRTEHNPHLIDNTATPDV